MNHKLDNRKDPVYDIPVAIPPAIADLLRAIRCYENQSLPYHAWSKCIRVILVCCLSGPLAAQNLLPDGGFEKVLHSDCVSPEQGFKKTQFWYPLDATPDLFEKSCPFDELEFVFWDADIEPYEGNNYAGIWTRWNSNATYFTEGIATALIRPLKAGKTYLFEMAIRNQGTYQGLDESVSGCSLNPHKHIDLYLSTDSIRIINNHSNGTSSTSATMVATLDSEDIQGAGTDDWTLVSTCFEAQGGEMFFAIMMPLGTFGELPPCAATQASSGVFRSFYYNLDATSVTELPAEQERQINACEGQRFEVDLLKVFDLPFLNEASFHWEDGQEAVSRTLTVIKEYLIEARLDCGTIPLKLTVNPQICQTEFYIPNAFSPNSDGHNDRFEIYLADTNSIHNFRLSIFDRWGSILFQTVDPVVSWDGKSRNRDVPPGVYAWVLSYDISDGPGMKKVIESGDVLILR